jgi:putative copper export protein
MFMGRSKSVKASVAMRGLAIVTAIGMEGELFRAVAADVSRSGFRAAVLEHPFGIAFAIVLWGLLPLIFFWISRLLAKEGR